MSPVMEERTLNNQMNISVEEFKERNDLGSYIKQLSNEKSKHEVPKSNSEHNKVSYFTCNCERIEGINYGCSRALNWFNILNKHKHLNLDKMR